MVCKGNRQRKFFMHRLIAFQIESGQHLQVKHGPLLRKLFEEGNGFYSIAHELGVRESYPLKGKGDADKTAGAITRYGIRGNANPKYDPVFAGVFEPDVYDKLSAQHRAAICEKNRQYVPEEARVRGLTQCHKNRGIRLWTPGEVIELYAMRKEGYTLNEIAVYLNRTPKSLSLKLSRELSDESMRKAS